MAARRHCPNCGKEERSWTIDANYCRKCGAPMNKNDPFYTTAPPIPEPEKINITEEDEMETKKTNPWLVIIVIATAILIIWFGYNLVKQQNDQIAWINEQRNQLIASLKALESSKTQVAVAPPASYVTAADNSTASNTMALNERTSLDPLDMPLWNDYYKSGVQVTDSDSDTVWYAQSGKDGTNRLWGNITKEQILVLDCYTLVKDGVSYDKGNLLMLRGPVDFNQYEIYYTDGAVQIVDPNHAQELLDYNIAVKFARGDWDKNKEQFSYKPWALARTWTLDYTYHPLKLSVKTDNYAR